MAKFISRTLVFLAMLIAGGIFLFTSIREKVEWDKPHGDLDIIKETELYDGKIVEGEIYDLFDEFAYTAEYDTTLGVQTSKERTTDRYFALPLTYAADEGRWFFIALSSRNSSELRTLEKIENETLDYYFEDVLLDDYTTTHFVGRVQKLDKEYLGFFREYIGEMFDVSGSELDEYCAPYVLESYTNPNSAVIGIVIGAILVFIGLVGMALSIIRKGLTGV